MNGKLIGVGVGPGDPELITLKALRLIQTAAVIAYTVDKNGNCYAKNSTKDYFPYGIRELPLTFSMACDRTERIQYRQNAANQLRDILHTGQDVVFITEGDPLLYSTFQHLCTALSSEIQIEVCPGISAMNAAAAAARFPLVIENEKLIVASASDGLSKIDQWLAEDCSIVLFKAARELENIQKKLGTLKKDFKAVRVDRVTTPEEFVQDYSEDWGTQQAPYFSILLIRPEITTEDQPK